MTTTYEIERQETIKRNQEYLKSLDLVQPVAEKVVKKVKKEAKPKPVAIVRQSRRLSGKPIDTDIPKLKEEAKFETLVPFDSFFDEQVRQNAITTDGRFTG